MELFELFLLRIVEARWYEALPGISDASFIPNWSKLKNCGTMRQINLFNKKRELEHWLFCLGSYIMHPPTSAAGIRRRFQTFQRNKFHLLFYRLSSIRSAFGDHLKTADRKVDQIWYYSHHVQILVFLPILCTNMSLWIANNTRNPPCWGQTIEAGRKASHNIFFIYE